MHVGCGQIIHEWRGEVARNVVGRVALRLGERYHCSKGVRIASSSCVSVLPWLHAMSKSPHRLSIAGWVSGGAYRRRLSEEPISYASRETEALL